MRILRRAFCLTNLTRKMNMFTQKINPITGTSEWELKDEHYDYFQEIARSSFADMLHDTERNQKYFLGLQAAIIKVKESGKKAYVLDIGTGTGLLSMMAVKCGADSVTACEAFQPISQCALKIIKDNHYEHDIKIISKRSTELTVGEDGDLKHRANILVTEVFDTELIGEGALGTFEHAHRELLEKDCFVVPSSATIYAQVVESPLSQSWNTLKSITNTDGEILLETPTEIKKCFGSAAVHDLQLSQLPEGSFKTIVPPTPVLSFDWTGKTSLLFNRCNLLKLKSECVGIAHAVFVWWDLKMDMEGSIVLSCAPYWAHPDINQLLQNEANTEYKQDLIPWRDHWMQAIYYLPQSIPVQQDQELTLISCHDEYSLWFNLKSDLKVTDDDCLRPVCSCGLHIAHSRTRIGQLNDGKRNKKYVSVLEDVVDSNTVCLSISDGSIIPLTAIKMGAKHLYCLERNSILQKLTRKYIAFNNLQEKVTILENMEQLKAINLKEITLVFGEPNFVTSLVPWDSFQYKYIIDTIRSELSDNVKVIPLRAVIKGIAVEFLNLHKIRAPLGDCEGFIMDKFDKLIHLATTLSDYPVEPQPLWEYPCKALSNVFELYKVDFQNQTENNVETSGEIDILGTGTCNGVALWVEWNIDGSKRNNISTGPVFEPEINKRIVWDMHTRQGVYLMGRAKTPTVNKKLTFTVNYNNESNSFSFSFKKQKRDI